MIVERWFRLGASHCSFAFTSLTFKTSLMLFKCHQKQKTHHLIKLLCHFSNDLGVLHVSEHLSTHSAYVKNHRMSVKHINLLSDSQHCVRYLPLHPEHWMKKLIKSKRATSLSCLYASIQSSTTDYEIKHDQDRLFMHQIQITCWKESSEYHCMLEMMMIS